MTFLDKLESRFSRYAVHHFIRVVVVLNAAVFILVKFNPQFLSVLQLDPVAIMHGEIWRLVTFIFIPQFGGLLPDWLSVALYLWFLWFIGDGVEQGMGAFRANLFYLTGMAGTIVAAFFFGGNFSNALLNTSLLFAFVRYFPDAVVYILFVLPLKMRWLAWFYGALLVFGFFAQSWSYRAAMLVSLANCLLFFGADIFRAARHRNEVTVRRARFETTRDAANDEPLHECAVCKRTDRTNPELDFRVSKDGHEYCTEHLPSRVATS